MPAASPSPDEEARLQALSRYEEFGTEPEPAFDRITRLAARIFRVPVVLITLVERDRQWLKSHHGVDLCEIARDLSFCSHAILLPAQEVFVVPDAESDPRFADNPLVTGPAHVRFYAGAPLRTPDGLALGALCLIDTVARPGLGDEERAMLTDLAATVMEVFEQRLARARERTEAAERRRVEEELQLSFQHFRHMAANTPGMVYQFILNEDGSFHFPFVGEGCQEFFGVGPPALYAQPKLILAAFDPAGKKQFYTSINQSAQTLAPWQSQIRYRTPDGAWRWLEGRARPQRLPGGTTLWSGVLMDITERKQAEARLEDSHALLRAVIDGTDDAVFLKDRESRYLLINPAGAALLGRPAEEIIGRDDRAFFSPEVAASAHEHDRQVMSDGRSLTYEDNDIVAGADHSFLTTKSPYRNAAGNLVGVIGIARNVSAQRRAAVALHEAKEEAEQANRAKSEFLSRMSHELRTPLNAILGFGQLLELSDLDTRRHQSVGHILRAGRHLLSLIDEVLAISRIEAGRLSLSLEPVAVGDMARECLHFVTQLAAGRGIVCENRTNACTDEGRYVRADRQRLRQVLLNLLSNAVKYNREGGRVTLACHVLDPVASATTPGPWMRLEVRDTGLGLTPADIGRLFTPFERLDAGHSRTEGTGLGLALSKGLVEAMGGRIGVDSVPGEGSTFWIELPQAADPLTRAGGDALLLPAFPEEDCRGTVLYVEDNLSNLALIECLLEAQPGLELLSAQQGLLGLEMAQARQPDLILLDLHLPDLPGWEVLAKLQADARTREIPVVVISADATPGQIARLREAGAQEYLSKPIDVRELMRMLADYLKPAAVAAA